MRIYINNSGISTLISFIKYSDIEIVTTPECYFNGQHIHFNFDAVLYMDGQFSNSSIIEHAKCAGIPFYGIPRYDKQDQTILMKKYGINIPDTWFSNNFDNCNDLVSLLYDVTDDEKLIIKNTKSARGLGQALLTKRELIDMFDSIDEELRTLFYNDTIDYSLSDEPCNSIKETKNNVTKLDDHKQANKLKNIKINKHDNLYYSIKDRKDFMIQEYIEKRQEWRMLWFHDQEPIIVKRDIGEGSWQANACNNYVGSSYTLNLEDISEMHEFSYKKINEFMLSLNAPFMSIDIYLDEVRKEWGLFEFQMEFGWTNTVGIDSQILNQRMLNSVKSLITKQK